MSDAIMCRECRWWRTMFRSDRGHCELSPPVYTGGEPSNQDNWHQPATYDTEGCSHGERRTEPEGETCQ